MDDVIEAVLDNPDHNFTSFLFESDGPATIKLLSEIVSKRNGHNIVVQCLSIWQDFQQSEHSFSVILDELQHAVNVKSVENCVQLVNNLLEKAPDSIARIRVRHELEELEFGHHLKNVCQRFDSNILDKLVTNFFVLCSGVRKDNNNINVIPVIECRHTDADSGTFSSEDEDMSSHNDSVIKNPEIAEDLNSLLLSLDDHEQLKLLIKKIKNSNDAPNVLRTINENLNKPSTSALPPPPPPPPPGPPPAPQLNLPKPPPPPPLNVKKPGGPPPPPPPLNKAGGPGQPPVAPANGLFKPTQQKRVEIPAALKPKVLPAEGKKLRHLQWTKIPANGLQNESNIWLNMSTFGSDLVTKLNFKDLDQYFEVSEVTSELQQPKEEKEAKSNTVSLLNSKRSLSINVFLRAAKGVENLIEFFKKGNSEAIGIEQLKMLVPLLPTEEECQTLNNYTADKAQLGAAEQFLLQLMSVQYYKIRLDCMILKEEFAAFIANVQPDLELLIRAGSELKTSPHLKKVLYILLHMGNYLNHGAGVGNAVAFKLSSLWKIDELKAKKSDRTLLNVVAQEAHKLGIHLEGIKNVQEAAKVPFESLKSEMKGSSDRLNRLENQLTNKNDDFFNEFRLFLERSKEKVKKANVLLDDIEVTRKELAVYFCENEKTFSLEECFKIFANFLTKYKNAMNENLQREERQQRIHDKSSVLPPVPSIKSLPPSPPPARVTSPVVSRKPSIVTEQDRGRESFPLTPYQRRKSSMRRESVFENVGSNNDLSLFVDEALNARKSSRVSQSPVFNELKETPTEKSSEEVVMAIPQKIVEVRPQDVNESRTQKNFTSQQIGSFNSHYQDNTKPQHLVNTTPQTIVTSKPKDNIAVIKDKLINTPVKSEPSQTGMKVMSDKTPGNSVNRTMTGRKVTGVTTTSMVKPGTAVARNTPPSSNLSSKSSTSVTSRARENGEDKVKSSIDSKNSGTVNTARTVLRRVPIKEKEPEPISRGPMSRRSVTSKIRTRSSAVDPVATEKKELSTCPIKPSDIRANRLATSTAPSWARPTTASNSTKDMSKVYALKSETAKALVRPSDSTKTTTKSSFDASMNTARLSTSRPTTTSLKLALAAVSPKPSTMTSPKTSTTSTTLRPSSTAARVAAINSRTTAATPVRSTVTDRTGKSSTTSSASPVATKARSGMSASERRSLFKKTDSVSTASRPALIKTGSISEKPRWLG
ncbi:unnamed protein product [Bursaphelenchus okinawaensis]|uniref:FH2 domain-containing protein n=1 Tax=Bursaphelenchus okinawaensis TaxID=465554 RepID=A0A811KHJ8_9BILA|nr:unnamed protein product [Bursaphelenchus okinawaensis]CAG9103261.1 unnamed protein product [Bursaphelenchus okinawaensis]